MTEKMVTLNDTTVSVQDARNRMLGIDEQIKTLQK